MKKNIILTAFSLLLLYGCTGDMERIQTGTNTEELIYADAAKTRQILNNLYARTRLTQGSFSSFSGDGVTFLDCATDNAYAPIEYSSAHTHGKSTMSASDIAMNGGHPWTFYYNSIRNATLFIQKVDKSVLSDEEKASSKLQARFLRALYYAELYRWYGGVVLLGDEIIPPTDLDRSRSTAEATVDYIVSELADVASQLPLEWDAPNYGRATKGAALAYIARTKLYAASKLNNPSMDRKKWEDARDALSAVMGLNIYDLYYDTQNPELSYAHYFCERKTKENIYTYLLAANATMHSNLPQGAPWNEKSYVGCTPTQNLVDAYDMKDGTEPITGYDANGQPIINKNSGYDDKNPYENRDPRLKMTIFYHGNTFDLNGSQQALDMTDVDDKSKSSGYLVLKYLDDRIGHKSSGNSNYDCNPQMIRYAEILLSYVEALNNLTGSHTVTFSDESTGTYTRDMNEMAKYFNMVRYRAGLPGLTTDELSSADKMFDIIVRERMIEFLHENRRFYDVRRWGIYLDTEKEPIVGMNTDGFEDEFFQRTTVNHLFARTRVADKKMVFLPIPRAELRKVPLMDQNPGWDN